MVEAIHFFFEGIGGAKPLLDNYIKIEKKTNIEQTKVQQKVQETKKETKK